MGAWDAMGRGISSGVQAWLERIRQAEAAKQRATDEAFREKQFGLLQAGQRESLSQYEDERALEEQLRHKAELGALDPRSDLSRNIYIPMFENGIPLSEEEKTRRYQEGITAWEAKQAELSEQEYQRRLEEIKYGAQMRSQYPTGAGQEPAEEPFFLNGEINPPGAFRELQSFIQFYTQGRPELFWADPTMQEQWVKEVELRFGEAVPGAGTKTRNWLYQASAQAGNLPPLEAEIPRTPKFRIYSGGEPIRQPIPHEQIPQSIPGTPDIEKEMPQSLGGGIPFPTSPPAQSSPASPGIVDRIRGFFGGREKTLEDFIAEVRATNPELTTMPGAAEQLAQRKYQEYLRNR